MAREYARIRVRIADDEDLESLSPAAQWLYFRVFLPDPTLSSCGVGDWRPKRLLTKARDIDLDYVLGAAGELEERRYALFDTDTDEYLVRTYIRNDELLRNPKMAANVVKSYRAIASKTLRAGVVSELKRAKAEHPDYSSWTAPYTAADLGAILGRPDLDAVGYTRRITNRIGNEKAARNTNRIGNRISDHISNGIGNRNGNNEAIGLDADYQSEYQSDYQPHSLQPATYSPKPSALNLQPGGLRSPVAHQANGKTTSPPRCFKHRDDPNPPACGQCAEARKRHEFVEAEHVVAERREKANRRIAIDSCEWCDDNGIRHEPAEVRDFDLPAIRCTHEPMAVDEWRALAPIEVEANA
jgi:hypothetical protein